MHITEKIAKTDLVKGTQYSHRTPGQNSMALLAFTLIRPANSVMVGFAVIVGIAVASHKLELIFSLASLLGFLTGFSISSFSMITNDIYDIPADKMNQPEKPLASGEINVSTAWKLSLVFLAVGLGCSFLLGPLPFVIGCAFALVGWSYNYHVKKLGLLGNTLVAASVAIPFIFGSVSLGDFAINLAYLLALTSFLAGFGREILKGISDVVGDKVRNVRSVAVSRGTGTAERLAATFFVVAVASSAFPLVLGLLDGLAFWFYLILIIVPDAIFVYLSYRVIRMRGEQESRKLKSVALAGMLAGLLTYLVAGLA